MSNVATNPVAEEQAEAVANAMLRLLSARSYSPRIKLLSLEQVCESTGMSVRTINRKVAEGTFPKPIPISGKRVWRESTLIAFYDRLEGRSS